MKEINYTVFDKISGLPVYGLDDGFVREMAQRKDKSLSEFFNEIKSELQKEGIKYFVSHNKKEIIVTKTSGLFKCIGEYFLDYDEAKECLKELKTLQS